MSMESVTVETSLTQHRMYVGGQWVPAVDGATYRLTSPATGTEIAELPSAGAADVDRAITAAREAFRRWESASLFDRAAWCHRVAEVIDARRTDLARELTVEHGKPILEAMAEVASAAEGFRLAAEEAKRLTGQTVPVRDASKRVLTIRRPKGVWAVITPFNFPINIPVEYMGPALATGNPFVWKPAPSTSRIAIRLAECIEEADVPPGLVNTVTGPSVEMSQHLVSHPGVIGVGFTGSSAAGGAIAKAGAGKHLLLELGGNGPVIVLEDADLSRTVEAVGSAAFWNAGQSCAAAERIISESAVHDGLVDGLTEYAHNVRLGEPWLETTTMGPVHNAGVAEKMDRHLADAVAGGAVVAFGGGPLQGMPTPLYYQPTVVRDVPPSAAVHEEETFGPIAPVTRVDGDEEILGVVNRSRLGLSCAIFTRDLRRALMLAERIEHGQVVVNDTSNYWELHMPFGGWSGKDSGMGRIGGRYTLETMTEVRSISIDVR